MQPDTVRVATADDEDAVVKVIVNAFESDPMARWCWPDSADYHANMAAFIRAFGGRAFDCDGAHCTDDQSGAALWLSPETHPDENSMVALVDRTVSESTRGHLFGVLEQMASFHPSERHWYLPLIGVGPSCQGKGYGSALLAFALQQFDGEGLVAYLESSNPRNILLYERHGFERLGEIQVGTSPVVVPMARQPR